MRLSTRSRYGARMMLDLAMHYEAGPVQLKEISRRQEISVKYLEQIIIPLKKAKFVSSIRGPKGGHMLAIAPDQITIGQIVDVLEGGIAITACVKDNHVCQRSPACSMRGIWVGVSKLILDQLNSVSLQELVRSEKGLTD